MSCFDVGTKIKKAVVVSSNDKWKVLLQPISNNDARAIDMMTSWYVTNVVRSKYLLDESKDIVKEAEIVAAEVDYKLNQRSYLQPKPQM